MHPKNPGFGRREGVSESELVSTGSMGEALEARTPSKVYKGSAKQGLTY